MLNNNISNGYSLDELYIPNMKRLTRGEQQYLRKLWDGLDNQLLTVSEWLGSDEAAEFYGLHQSELNEFFMTSGIREELNNIIESNASDSHEFIQKFYNVGSRLGYNDLHKKLLFTPADREALHIVSEYNFDLITDLNTNLFTGIRETIFQAVLEGQGADTTTRQILELGLKPLPLRNGAGKVVRYISARERARMIARTEHARAVNTGTLQAYSNFGVDDVEIITAGDDAVCDDCLDLADNNPYSLMEAQSLLPAHPNCRCSFGAVVEKPLLFPEDNPVIVDLTRM